MFIGLQHVEGIGRVSGKAKDIRIAHAMLGLLGLPQSAPAAAILAATSRVTRGIEDETPIYTRQASAEISKLTAENKEKAEKEAAATLSQMAADAESPEWIMENWKYQEPSFSAIENGSGKDYVILTPRAYTEEEAQQLYDMLAPYREEEVIEEDDAETED